MNISRTETMLACSRKERLTSSFDLFSEPSQLRLASWLFISYIWSLLAVLCYDSPLHFRGSGNSSWEEVRFLARKKTKAARICSLFSFFLRRHLALCRMHGPERGGVILGSIQTGNLWGQSSPFISAPHPVPHLLSMLLFSLHFFLHQGNAGSSSVVALMNKIKHFRRNKLKVEPYSFLQYIDSSHTGIVSWALLFESQSDIEMLELLVPSCVSEVKCLQSI